jgi:hypothetical protein
LPYTGQDPESGDDVAMELRCDIVSVSSGTAVVVQVNRDVPAVLQNVATTNWQMARQTFSGLSHLEGQTVNILSDGNVEPQKVVTGGAVTLESPGAVVHIGLPINAQFETLDVNVNNQETLLDKKQLINTVTLVVNASRGIFASTLAVSGTNTRSANLSFTTIRLMTPPVKWRSSLTASGIKMAASKSARLTRSRCRCSPLFLA